MKDKVIFSETLKACLPFKHFQGSNLLSSCHRWKVTASNSCDRERMDG